MYQQANDIGMIFKRMHWKKQQQLTCIYMDC